MTFFKSFLQSRFLDDTEPSREDLFQLRNRLENFKVILSEFDKIQDVIEGATENIDDEYQYRQDFENEYYELLGKAQSLIDLHSKAEVSSHDSERGSESGAFVESFAQSTLLNTVRLPTIDLPKFSGDYHTWVEFRDTFESLIHTNTKIGDIQRFHYLRSSLEGSAKQIIDCLEFSAGNYKIAWDLLCARYNNKRLLVYNHIKSIYEIPTMNHESSSDLRKLIDSVTKHLRALENLGQPTNAWDTLIIFSLANKLDRISFKEWEKARHSSDLPTLEDFTSFIKGRADLLETIEMSHNKVQNKHKFQPKTKSFATTFTPKCLNCSGTHNIRSCKKFLDMPIADRRSKIKSLNCCFNCLKANHLASECTGGLCKFCKMKHHSLLHLFSSATQNSSNELSNSESTVQTERSHSNRSKNSKIDNSEILLSTALILVKDSSGKYQTCRALLDSASMSNFITSSCCDKLGLDRSTINMSVIGIGQASSSITDRCTLHFKSHNTAFRTTVSCLIIRTISDSIPMQHIDYTQLKIPEHVILAYPEFYIPSSIDILLGANVFWHLINSGQIVLGKNMPILQSTSLGYVVSGAVKMSTNKRRTVCNLAIQNIQDQLAKLWLIEEPPGNKGLISQEDKVCGEIFVKTLERSPDGRFVVEIPFKEPISRLGDSKQVALKRLYSLENKFAKDPQLKQAYCDFMSTYEKAGYMVLVPNPEIDTTVSYYLPHHGVPKKDSTTTPLRVVFDGSSPSDTNVSLNQLQYVGPQDVQSDLYSILLRFRSHNIVISGDISKMFLQIKVKERQRDLLRVLWRSEPSEEVKTYCLTTVPFGLRSSPFLAVRCLKQLSLENAELHPIACDIISNDFYMDDLLSGTSTEEEAIQVCKDIFSILKSSGFMLGKWKSNSVNVLNAMQVINTSKKTKQFGEQNQTKTLSLYWDSDKDFLKFRVSKADECKTITKRTMLSEIAQIFDPLGLVSPTIVVVKILLQSLWQANISWDNEIPNDVLLKWKQFKRELPLLNSIEIPRHVICKNPARIELHGFCDASTKAYGAVVYLRSVDVSGNIQVTLLCSKSKVAPIKMLTTPRLELCGALVLAQLVSKVKEALNIHIDDTFLWSDSTVVLNWIRASPNQFQIFIANRITQIQNATSMDYWHYISTKENPADLVSRGVLPSKLIANKLWLHGPLWPQEAPECWRSYSSLIPPVTDLPERKKTGLSYGIEASM
nr:unnamed protein product [Callosobruchus analis]